MQKNYLQATGIVAEYNPFHNGHLYHVQETKRLTGLPVIAVMSGSFMQRGEPAILSKWQRASLAIAGGVDLVVELPTAFSLRSAQFFAQGAVQILNATGCVSHLACGVESPELDFTAIAAAITAPQAQERLKALLNKGLGYAAACAQVLPEFGLTTPNDILALEYCKALQNTNIRPLFIKRHDRGYNSTEITVGTNTLASATAIRQALRQRDNAWQQAVPPATAAALHSAHPGYDETLLWQLLRYRLRLFTAPQIAARCQCSEGLENLLKSAADCATLQKALAVCTNKRYSTSRIRRLLLQLLLDRPRSQWEQDSTAYNRVLAFNDTGRQLLKAMKTRATLPILTKLGKHPYAKQNVAFQEQLALDCAATDLWSLLQLSPKLNHSNNDSLLSPIYATKEHP